METTFHMRVTSAKKELVCAGGVAVLISGAPRRSSHHRLRDAIVRQAARFQAHRRRGVAILRVHFGAGFSPGVVDGSSLFLGVDIADSQKSVRMQRVLALLVLSLCLFVAFDRALGRDGRVVGGKDVR